MKTVVVKIPGYEYSIAIGSQILSQNLSEAVLKSGTDFVIVVTNSSLHKLYPNHVPLCLEKTRIPVETCILPDGEQYKNLETLNQIYNFLLEKRANRKTLLIAFGGGVLGDMTGFAAATYMRGIDYIQIPTTLLSQVDSSIGGKTAVNHPLGKNMIGAFKQPIFVCMESDFLKTLPPRELKAGFFELIKHGIIHDSSLFSFLREHSGALDPLNLSVLEQAIESSCQVKARIVEKDEKEKGLRATLNFGHTLGHLIETHTNYSSYLHGEAVGVGMVFAAFVSYELKYLTEPTFQQIISFLKPFITPVVLPSLNFEAFQELIMHDKKFEKDSVNFIMISGIGQSFIQEDTSPKLLWRIFKKFIESYPWACQVQNN
ncbi:MAG: 3-dehydroquinate synthase [SAR324 cluster bacterium]|nr:3-dehydroquinate synthase [SAR324 cluster bacterium]